MIDYAEASILIVVGSLCDVLFLWYTYKFTSKKEESKWKGIVSETAMKAKDYVIEYIKQEAEKPIDPNEQIPIKVDTSGLTAQFAQIIDEKLEKLRMSEMGKMSGLVRSTQAAQVALASESNPRLMGILTGLGMSKKESAAIMMALAESGAVPGFAQASNRSNGQSSLPGI